VCFRSLSTRVTRVDFKALARNLDDAARNVELRKVDADPRHVVRLWERYRKLQSETEELQREKREIAKQQQQHEATSDESRRAALRHAGADVKHRLQKKTEEVTRAADELEQEAARLPNVSSVHSPVGDESKAVEVKKVLNGHTLRKDSDHVKILQDFDWADFASAAQASGEGFVYVKNDLALLEMSIVQYALQKAARTGFTPVLTPEVVRDHVLSGCGFRPRVVAHGGPVYNIAGEEESTSLIGTAEVSLAGMFVDRILPAAKLPMFVAGFSHSFRREAGQGGGRYSRGLYRLHQFSKVELFAVAAPEESEAVFEKLVGWQTDFLDDLKLPYRVLEMPTEELGLSAARKRDCEVWMPSRGDWGEVTSASDCTDFQARRLNVRMQLEVGNNHFVHTLNATAAAVPRLLISVLENHYDAARNVVVLPTPLVPLMGCESIPRKN
jgi:seryl-tRNA synthetase